MAGEKGTYGILSNRLVIDMSEKIAELEPNAAPLTVLMKKMKKTRAASSAKVEWMEQELGARWDAVNNGGGYADNATEITVDNGSYFRVNDIVKVPRTGEVLLVTAIVTNALTVTRSFGATAAAAMVDNDPLVIIGNANAEFASLRTIKSPEPTAHYNYTQIFRTPVGASATLEASKVYGPKPMSWYRHIAGIEHKTDMERAFLFGERGISSASGQNMRTTGGLLEFCTQNVLDVSSTTLTEQSFVEWLEDVFRYGGSEKILLATPRLCTHIDLWALGKLQTVPKEKTYGVGIKEYMSTHGKLYVVKHHLLEGAVYGGYGIVLDMANIAYCPLRDTKLKTNVQANDEDGQKDEYITEATIEVRLPKSHAIIKGVA